MSGAHRSRNRRRRPVPVSLPHQPPKESCLTDREPPPSNVSPAESDVLFEDAPLSSIQEISSASRSCLVILALAVVIVVLVCVSWIVRILF